VPLDGADASDAERALPGWAWQPEAGRGQCRRCRRLAVAGEKLQSGNRALSNVIVSDRCEVLEGFLLSLLMILEDSQVKSSTLAFVD